MHTVSLRRMGTERRVLFGLILFVTLLFALPLCAKANRLNKKQAVIQVGGQIQLVPKTGTASSYSSTDSSIASVDSYGTVTGLSAGTVNICASVSGETLKCRLTVRRENYSAYVSNELVQIWLNIVGAVESGGQVYGQRNYKAFAGPMTNSSAEYSCTAGAYQEYGENLRQLLLRIKKEYPYTFKKYDKADIASDIARTWSDSSPYAVSSTSAKARSIIKIIGCSAGRIIQDRRAAELFDAYAAHIISLGVTNLRAILFLAEIEHQGGPSAVVRIVNRAKNKNKIAYLWKSLILDASDTSNSNQVGDVQYQPRHKLCYKWIKANIPKNAVI